MAETLPGKFRDRTEYTYAQVEGALCAWEWMIHNADRAPLKGWFETIGSSGMRMVSMQVGDICNRVYKHMEANGYEFEHAYDWMFVPGVIGYVDWDLLIDDNQYNGAPYDPDIHAIFTAMVAADKALRAPGDRYFNRVVTEAGKVVTMGCQENAPHHVVKITVTVTVAASSAPVAGHAVGQELIEAIRRRKPSLLSGARFELCSFEKPAIAG